MPKLDSKTAGNIDAAESNEYEPLPADTYNARLQAVTVKEGQKAPYWSWEFTIEHPDYKNRKMWANTSLSPAAAWKMKEMFDAFDVSPDTDTDLLCGERVRLIVTQRVIEGGARAGQVGNNVDRVMQADPIDLEGDDLGDF
jgi:hypothetical protein